MSISDSTIKLAVITPVGRESLTIKDFVLDVQSKLKFGEIHYLVTDDFTDFETKMIISEMELSNQFNIMWIDMQVSAGIASVYLEGYKQALKGEFTHFMEIDAGYSHDPAQIESFREAAVKYEIVLGSRFISKGALRTTLGRKILSAGGSFITKIFLGLPELDLTSGYQLFSRKALIKILETEIVSRGPFFQTEMKCYGLKSNFSYTEIPITYSNPSRKITYSDVAESLLVLMRLAFK